MRTHLVHLDRAIARLLDERARVCAAMDGTFDGSPAVEDVLKRADGDFDADALRSVFECIERGCRARQGGAR